MKNIDFLPDRYQERDLKRKATLWQYALLLGFGSVLLAATLGQFVMKRSLQASLAELKQGRIETNLKRERVQLLKQQLGNTEPVAALFTYLQHPWPRTQLIARITDALPESIVLDGVEIFEQQPNRSAFSSNEARAASSASSPAAADLLELRGDHDVSRLIVRIRGTAEETAALNEYVQQLGEVRLFRSVSLSSLQSQASQGKTMGSAFELNLIVRPGHGQPGGPKGPLATHEQIAQHSAGRQAQ